MKFLEKNKHFLVVLITVYVFLMGVYYFTSAGIANNTLFLQMRRYIPCTLSVTLTVLLWEKSGYGYKDLIPHAIVGILWVLVYPICYWYAYHTNTTFIDNHFDQAFGAYIFAFTVCLRLLFLWCAKRQDGKTLNIIFALMHTIALSVPVTQILYFIYYKYPFTETAAIAMLQTNPNEAKEYLLLNLGYGGIVGIGVLFILLFAALQKLNKISVAVNTKILNRKMIAGALLIVVATGGYGIKMFGDTGVAKAYLAAKDYFDKSNLFRSYHEEHFKNLVVEPSQPVFSKPSTIIMVIGESASPYYMSAYSDVKNNNTPWLRSKKIDDNFIVYTHVYTSVCQTVPALERALTEKNQYNSKEFNQSLTVIDIAKKAGYETYWFSNQGFIGGADTPITLIAKTADHSFWLSESKDLNSGYKYDGDLLPYLKNVDPTKNNFVVLHIIGSHEDCINRYPYDFAKFSEKGKFDMPLNYDDSLLYTDLVLQQVHQYATENLNLQAMLYFSDHGGDPYRKRHPDKAGFKSLQVPMFVYVSDEYKRLFNGPVEDFFAHKNTYFTNDMMYEVVCNLLQIKSNHYDETNSLLNKEYKYTRDMLTTNLGKWKIIDDKEPRKNG